jgi:Cdc6-like AAA superfamily ATPase
MSNPKDWFRRRHREPHPLPGGESGDPFETDAVLAFDDSSDIVPLSGEHRPFSLSAREGAVEAHSSGKRGPVPPPPPRNASHRPPRLIGSGAFLVRPEVIRLEDPSPPAPPTTKITNGATHANGAAAGPENGKAPIRRRAVPLTRAPVADGPTGDGAEPAAPRWGLAVRPNVQSASERATNRVVEHQPKTAGAPSFTLSAPGTAWARGRATGDSGAVNAALREAFTPTRPKQQDAQFSGRYTQMQRIINAIEEERAHVVLYGERGSGKTSLANVVAAKATEAGYFVVKFACSSEMSFEEMFHSFLQRIPATFLAGGIGATNRAGISNFDELLSPGEISVTELVTIFARLHDKHVILVVDEYDRVTSEETKNKLAELIKNMSDASAPVTILLIGVAEDVDELLGKHPSLQRTLVTIPLPLMTAAEIEAIILGGEQKSGLHFAPAVRRAVVELAQGLPYHAQLLCLFAARNALRRHASTVEREDLRYAVQRAAEEAEGKIKEAYSLAAASQSGTAFKDVLFAAARCTSDAFGIFAVSDVAQAAATHGIAVSALSLQFPLKKLTEPSRGGMLRRISGLDGLRYQFVNQMLRHHVLVRQAIERGLV